MSLSVDEMWDMDNSRGLGGGESVTALRPRDTWNSVSRVEEGQESEGCGLLYVTSFTVK